MPKNVKTIFGRNVHTLNDVFVDYLVSEIFQLAINSHGHDFFIGE
jgi:hypothetical protein